MFARSAIRGFDIAASLALLAIAALPMLAIAAAIRLADGGPALFRQPRVGRGGETFLIFKFRTMRIERGGAAGGSSTERARVSTMPGDPRITPLGRLLRPSHLDELPQILNVLRGEMSLVGVRPDTPAQEADYAPDYWRRRHAERPGITGPAQLRSDPLDLAERTREELRWLDRPSFGLYLRILLGTLAKVARRSSH